MEGGDSCSFLWYVLFSFMLSEGFDIVVLLLLFVYTNWLTTDSIFSELTLLNTLYQYMTQYENNSKSN